MPNYNPLPNKPEELPLPPPPPSSPSLESIYTKLRKCNAKATPRELGTTHHIILFSDRSGAFRHELGELIFTFDNITHFHELVDKYLNQYLAPLPKDSPNETTL